MLDFYGLGRGFAFAKYKTLQAAKRALYICDKFQIRHNLQLRVNKCRNYSRISIGKLFNQIVTTVAFFSYTLILSCT